MRIRCQARDTGHGVFVSGIETEEKTERLKRFFRERGQIPIGPAADRQMLLAGLSLEQFSKLAADANIELINEPA